MDRYIEFATNHWMLFIALLVVTFLLIQDLIESALQNFESLSPILAVTKMNQTDAIILDVREPNEYSKGHIENAINSPLEKLDEHINQLESKKNSTFIVVCQTGTRSGPACKKLSKLGFDNLFKLAGGMQSWEENKLPIKSSKAH